MPETQNSDRQDKHSMKFDQFGSSALQATVLTGMQWRTL